MAGIGRFFERDRLQRDGRAGMRLSGRNRVGARIAVEDVVEGPVPWMTITTCAIGEPVTWPKETPALPPAETLPPPTVVVWDATAPDDGVDDVPPPPPHAVPMHESESEHANRAIRRTAMPP